MTSSLDELKKKMKLRRMAMQSTRSNTVINPKNENPNITKIVDILSTTKNVKNTHEQSKKDELSIISTIHCLPKTEHGNLREAVAMKFGQHSRFSAYINTILDRCEKQNIKDIMTQLMPKKEIPKTEIQNEETVVTKDGKIRRKLQVVV